jgi:hypothetical protein
MEQSRPDSGLGFAALKTFKVVPSSLGSGWPVGTEEGSYPKLIH